MDNLKILKDELLNYTILSGLNFEDFTTYIKNPDNVDKIMLFLNDLMLKLNLQIRFNKKNTKNFLSSYMFIFHNQVIIKVKDEYNERMIFLSNNLISSFDSLFHDFSMKNILNFEKNYNEYLLFFMKWKERDSLIMIRPILQSYFELELFRDELKKKNNNDYLHVERKLKSLKYNIMILAGKEGLNYLKTKKIPVFKSEKMYTDIEKTVQKAFWDNFQENLNNNKLDQIPKLLKDIKDMIFQMVENKNFLKTFDDNIDLELISNIINSDSDKTDFMFKFINYLISLLYKLQPASEDKNTNLFEKTINDMFLNNNHTIGDILRFFFENYFKKLENIKVVTLHIKNNLKETKIEEI